MNRPPRTFFHCVHVRGDERKRALLGYVELFGYQRMVVLLSDSYAGRPFSQCYAVDPVAGRKIDLVVDLPDFSAEEIQAIYDNKRVDFEKTRIALGRLSRVVYRGIEQARALEGDKGSGELRAQQLRGRTRGGDNGGSVRASRNAVGRALDAVPLAPASCPANSSPRDPLIGFRRREARHCELALRGPQRPERAGDGTPA